MDSFIKKIFNGKIDSLVHLQFQKFSRGEFRDKARINASKSKDKYSISTTYEYAPDMVRSVAEKMPAGQKAKVSGAIISTRNLREIPELMKLIGNTEVKQFMGVKQFKIDTEMSGKEIVEICNMLPNSFLGLSFSYGDTELKIKAKAPKSSKPGSSAEKLPNPDFCKLKTTDILLVKSFLFDLDDFKKVEISHDFIITDIEIPKNENDPAKMREMAIRKGKIIRKINADGRIMKSEKAFEA
jgi:hypothetical protein